MTKQPMTKPAPLDIIDDRLPMLDKLREYEQITRMIEVFALGGRITTMGATTEPSVDQPPISAMISTLGWDYPAQMVTAIQGLLESQRQRLADELAQLGVTGLGQ